jgi:lipoate-protein ligase A
MSSWRWLDTGVRGAAENLALNRALTESRRAGESPSTLRFLRFSPAAIVALNGDPGRELDLEFCRAQGIEVQRRLSGGGAIYMDEGVLAWELYLDRAEAGAAEMPAIACRICEALARALGGFALDARFRAPSDVTVGGRKVSGSGGAIDDEVLAYQGTLLVDFDLERMLRALGAMSETKLAAARAGLADLRGLLGAPPGLEALQAALTGEFAALFGVRMVAGSLGAEELRRAARAREEMAKEEWVHRASREGVAARTSGGDAA